MSTFKTIESPYTELAFYRPSFDARVKAAKANGTHVIPENPLKLLAQEGTLESASLIKRIERQRNQFQMYSDSKRMFEMQEAFQSRKAPLRDESARLNKRMREQLKKEARSQTTPEIVRAERNKKHWVGYADVKWIFATTCKTRSEILNAGKAHHQAKQNKVSFLSSNPFERLT